MAPLQITEERPTDRREGGSRGHQHPGSPPAGTLAYECGRPSTLQQQRRDRRSRIARGEVIVTHRFRRILISQQRSRGRSRLSHNSPGNYKNSTSSAFHFANRSSAIARGESRWSRCSRRHEGVSGGASRHCLHVIQSGFVRGSTLTRLVFAGARSRTCVDYVAMHDSLARRHATVRRP